MELIHQEKDAKHGLRLYFKSYTTKSDHRVTVLRGEWFIPVPASEFVAFMNNIKEQERLDENIDEYFIKDSDDEENFSIYLSYKKLLVASARDFLYFKGVRQIPKYKGTEQSAWMEFSRSLPGKSESKAKIRAEILLSGHLIVDLPQDKANRAHRAKVTMYSEVDLKMSVPAFVSKKLAQSNTKKYIEKCIERMQALSKS
eukprot:TRINITY_DN1909_c0_g1_i4.p1 TRINITY_DN1909_c0_g1~~TRINITY_DN1909_c0_g1_i4.p1  ORF type:complete len:200 (-),score=25.40 TRINITY_DN1909_c0_g1_i4:97-696(-)